MQANKATIIKQSGKQHLPVFYKTFKSNDN